MDYLLLNMKEGCGQFYKDESEIFYYLSSWKQVGWGFYCSSLRGKKEQTWMSKC